MKYLITFIWAFIISQVTFYLGAALNQMTYNFWHACILALAATLAVVVIAKILPPIKPASQEEAKEH